MGTTPRAITRDAAIDRFATGVPSENVAPALPKPPLRARRAPRSGVVQLVPRSRARVCVAKGCCSPQPHRTQRCKRWRQPNRIAR